MKVFGYKLVNKKVVASEKAATAAEVEAKVESKYKEKYQDQIDDLKNRVNDLRIAERAYKRKVTSLEAERDALESERDNVREVAALEMKLADKSNELDARKEILDEKQSKLKARATELEEMEEANYQKGYADGVSDGLREIAEITQKDRDSAMKIAMVAAASHTPAANLKEITSVHQITSGDADKKA